jgi:RhtB (resistance to homoserine/threonine) family protein
MFDFFSTTYFATFIQITILNIIVLISPGPDFAVVVHNSLVYGRRTGIMTAVGITVGELVHLSYIILGFGSVVANNFWLLSVIKFCGCVYLVQMGFRMLFSKPKKINLESGVLNAKVISGYKAVLRGALTNFLNPKAILFFLSLFSIVVDVDTPMYILSLYGLSMLLTTLGWFAIVALFFSHPKLSNKLTSMKHWIERITGGMLIMLSVKLALTKEHPSS